jgi:superoxide dismutase, Cu-Zn family
MEQGKRLFTRRALIALLVAALAVLVTSATPMASGPGHSTAVLRGVDGQFVARVDLTQIDPNRVLVTAVAQGLTPGFHGFHIHTNGICDPTVGFTSAGGHFNPANVPHPGHAGNFPVLLVQQDGTAQAAVVTDRFKVADVNGRAVIIHAGADNLANIPNRYVQAATGTPGPDAATLATGDAGARVACGLVTPAA